jgi:hypothetical protein
MSMKSFETQPTSALRISQALKDFWRLPSLTVARFTLLSYLRSGWILGDIAIVWLLYAAFFLEFGGNVAYFFGTTGQGLGALAILGTIVMVQRAMSARVYLPLSRLTSRSSYIRGLIIATGVLRFPLYLMMMLLGMGFHTHAPSWGIQGATVTNMLVGSVGLLANCIVISTLVVVFSAPIATRLARIALLAWFAAMLYSNTSPGPLASFLSISRLPLIPMTACFNFGAAGSIGWSGVAALLIMALYVVGLTMLGEYWMSRRDLILQ